MSERLWILIPLLAGCVAVLVLLGLGLRAFGIERREGLTPSRRRVGLLALLALAAVGLTGWTIWATRAPDAPAKAGPAPALAPAVQKQLEAKQAELDQARKEVERLEAEVAAIAPGAGAAAAPQAVPPPVWPVLVMALLMLVSAVVLLSGELGDLLPWRRRKQVAAAGTPSAADPLGAMAALAEAVDQWRWADALAAAQRVHAEDLAKLELCDYLYLRAFAAVGEALALRDPAEAGAGAAPPALPAAERAAHLTQAESDLGRLLDLAPRMAEARYLLARVQAERGEHQAALDGYRAVKDGGGLGASNLPLAHDESVCLLRLAEARLGAADSAGASALFDQVTKLGVLQQQIPIALITHRLLEVQAAVRAGKLDEARAGLAAVRTIEGLAEAERRTAEVTSDVYQLLISHREGDHAATQAQVQAFLGRWLPAGLPAATEQSADEYLCAAVDVDTLLLPAELYRGFFFVLAVTQAEQAGRRGRAPDAAETLALAEPLLRALQFEPRQREALAALGVLYYWFRPAARAKALEWLEAAVGLGVRSRTVRQLVALARQRERERGELLDLFRSASARFLGDAMVSPQVRRALAEELGRFQDFQPILLELDGAPLELEPRPPTVAALRERARFVLGLAGEVAARQGGDARALAGAARELSGVVDALDGDATRLEELEKRVMEEVGKVVLR
ncbi:MAG: hypothetical protein IT370_38045 [Deltaproteobacteria bacterium]|nr:hypothetical protein [Deltaproteobacteria bacterium]